MNTINNIFDAIAAKENILLAIQRAACGKRKKRIVIYALKHADEIAEKLSQKLYSDTWRPNSIHTVKIINDGVQLKKREIVCPDFINEQIVHHAILNVCGPIFMQKFYRYSCASVPRRGVEFALKYIRKSLKDYRNTKYYAVLDVKKFFDSIRPSKVFRAIRRIIRDKRVLKLFAMILRANKIVCSNGEVIKRGTPIGLYTSPWLANILLTGLDNKIKAAGAKYYVRYNDDMLLFHSNKRKLKKILDTAQKHIQHLRLKIKRPYQIHRLDKVPFCYIGAQIYRNKIILQAKVFLRAKRAAAKITKKKKVSLYDAQKIVSYAGRFKHYDTYTAFKRYIADNVSIKKSRKIISQRSKKNVYLRTKRSKTTGCRKCRK